MRILYFAAQIQIFTLKMKNDKSWAWPVPRGHWYVLRAAESFHPGRPVHHPAVFKINNQSKVKHEQSELQREEIFKMSISILNS